MTKPTEADPQPAPELAAAMAEARQLRAERDDYARTLDNATTARHEVEDERNQLRLEGDELRAKLAAAEHFADIWRETLPELPDAYMCTYNCTEANAAADLYRALGDEDTAAAIIANHAHYDEEGDEHYTGQQAPVAEGNET
jgi:hypothetical protein